MATKKNQRNAITPELQTFIDQIAAKYQPDPEVLQLRIENAEARYNRTQQFSDIPGRLVDKLQTLILEGWRYRPAVNASVLANAAMIAVHLHKPEAMIEDELNALRSKVSSAYNDELKSKMEVEMEQLMNDASDDVKRRAEEQAAADMSAMKQQLRNLLTQGMV